MATDSRKAADRHEFIRFERDTNSGAGLHAVFLGDRALHHFRHDQKVERYIADVRRNVDAYTLAVRVQTLEDAAKRCEAMIGSLAVSRDRAKDSGRECVSACRQSDIETCERAAAAIRALKGE